MTDIDESTLEKTDSATGSNPGDEVIDFGTLAVRNGLLKAADLAVVQKEVDQAAAEGRRVQLEQLLVDRGILTQMEVKAVQKARERYIREQTRAEAIHITGYEILGTLGEGGLGVVYKAKQVSMNRLVALKVLHKHWVTDDEFRKRFILEARVVGKLSHQNLIQVYDVGKESGYYYFAMEYVPGKTVDQLIEDNGAMPVPEAVNIIIQVVRSLRYYKDFDIVHRDIKPSNIVTRQGIGKLGDFGFVKSKLDKELGFEGMVLGTPDYISPEQAMGDEHVDWRSDVYSLGATFYHMVTGQPPFDGSGSTVMLKHVKEQPASPKSLNPRLSDDVCHVIEKMMAKKRQDRYPTLELLFEDLELLRAGRSPAAPRLEVGKSTIFRAYKIEQSRLAMLAEDKRRLEEQVEQLTRKYDRIFGMAMLGGVGAAIFAILFVLALSRML
ncbi:MAG: serine/threonine protein kinase [Planctomycetota bacterium]